jgi:hypothetical protein
VLACHLIGKILKQDHKVFWKLRLCNWIPIPMFFLETYKKNFILFFSHVKNVGIKSILGLNLWLKLNCLWWHDIDWAFCSIGEIVKLNSFYIFLQRCSKKFWKLFHIWPFSLLRYLQRCGLFGPWWLKHWQNGQLISFQVCI